MASHPLLSPGLHSHLKTLAGSNFHHHPCLCPNFLFIIRGIVEPEQTLFFLPQSQFNTRNSSIKLQQSRSLAPPVPLTIGCMKSRTSTTYLILTRSISPPSTPSNSPSRTYWRRTSVFFHLSSTAAVVGNLIWRFFRFYSLWRIWTEAWRRRKLWRKKGKNGEFGVIKSFPGEKLGERRGDLDLPMNIPVIVSRFPSHLPPARISRKEQGRR